MAESKQADKVSELAKLVGYESETLRAVGLPEERLNDMFSRAQTTRRITNFVCWPALALVAATAFLPGTDTAKPETDIRLAIFMMGVAAHVGGVVAASKKNPVKELNQARDARLVALAKQQPGNQP